MTTHQIANETRPETSAEQRARVSEMPVYWTYDGSCDGGVFLSMHSPEVRNTRGEVVYPDGGFYRNRLLAEEAIENGSALRTARAKGLASKPRYYI